MNTKRSLSEVPLVLLAWLVLGIGQAQASTSGDKKGSSEPSAPPLPLRSGSVVRGLSHAAAGAVNAMMGKAKMDFTITTENWKPPEPHAEVVLDVRGTINGVAIAQAFSFTNSQGDVQILATLEDGRFAQIGAEHVGPKGVVSATLPVSWRPALRKKVTGSRSEYWPNDRFTVLLHNPDGSTHPVSDALAITKEGRVITLSDAHVQDPKKGIVTRESWTTTARQYHSTVHAFPGEVRTLFLTAGNYSIFQYGDREHVIPGPIALQGYPGDGASREHLVAWLEHGKKTFVPPDFKPWSKEFKDAITPFHAAAMDYETKELARRQASVAVEKSNELLQKAKDELESLKRDDVKSEELLRSKQQGHQAATAHLQMQKEALMEWQEQVVSAEKKYKEIVDGISRGVSHITRPSKHVEFGPYLKWLKSASPAWFDRLNGLENHDVTVGLVALDKIEEKLREEHLESQRAARDSPLLDAMDRALYHLTTTEPEYIRENQRAGVPTAELATSQVSHSWWQRRRKVPLAHPPAAEASGVIYPGQEQTHRAARTTTKGIQKSEKR